MSNRVVQFMLITNIFGEPHVQHQMACTHTHTQRKKSRSDCKPLYFFPDLCLLEFCLKLECRERNLYVVIDLIAILIHGTVQLKKWLHTQF